ncbi:heterokaryon incompatibility protein-domain-containing protein [Biscogniauxia sp. FL1348]|nr:heterokaryon incompatibility protein-domain-containing protein [Biscogniauxia sp. FL1348]
MRCEYCDPLNIKELRGNTEYEHHKNFAELKACAESKLCDICVLFWVSFNNECVPRDIEKCLLQPLSDAEDPRDVRVLLWTFLSDMDPRPLMTLPKGSAEGSGIMVSVGPMGHSRLYCNVSIYAEPNTAAARYLAERNTILSPDPQLRASVSKHWLSACQGLHPRCGGKTPTQMPTRVVDLDEPSTATTPKLKITGGEHDCYAALSYSWGEGVRHKVKLNRDTLDSFQQEIPTADMTLAHREALQIARELGYSYIWIDALCIIQGDKEDWAREAGKIADVYGNAELTIVAGRSNNSLQGFLEHTAEPSITCRIPYNRPHADIPSDAYCYLTLRRSKVAGPVDKRAWCFQESVLSRRMIVYGEAQLSFKCRQSIVHEDGNFHIYSWGKGGRYDLSYDALSDPALTAATVLDRWYGLSYQYAVRDLFDPTDNFATLAGVAFRFQQALKCRYLAGLWENDMIRGLLWRSRRIIGGPHTTSALRKPIGVSDTSKGVPVVRAPSWSWLALVGPIWPATGRTYDKKFQDPKTFRCFSADQQGGRWSPDDWEPRTVVYRLCRLEVIGCPLEVRCSDIDMSEYHRKPKWSFPKLKRHGVLLERTDRNSKDSSEASSDDSIVAVGLFDLADGNPLKLWVMCLSSDEGLMLEKNIDGSFSRLGIFIAEDDSWFQRKEVRKVTLI